MGVFEETSFGVPGECRCCGVKYDMPGTGVLRLCWAMVVVINQLFRRVWEGRVDPTHTLKALHPHHK